MAEQTSTNGWRRALLGAVTSGALAAGLLTGVSSASAVADPATDAVSSDAAPVMSADEALATIATEYDTGAGGGQISTLIHQVMQLRAKGFRPSTSNGEALVAALDKRPNQGPLVAALESTLSFQVRQASRQTGGGPVLNPPTIGIGGNGGGAPNPNGGGGINIPLG
ncbi:hypothetical protein D8S82_27790 [Mycobacterium hodleri]|uniref:DUF732 domain-containing protein n=1 Tax=Mycolicibacterium hodleri TaxID=49897 RepID=A0A544VTJ6_9MYCO|nr:hypothetical protein [Mycolicibacterium hodleri]TQR83317.1 hypothetical protein D8S82_27790 [Mycolicibacterium hodleri]